MGEPKVVLVTGATSGIGKATAELLAAKGYRVFGTSRAPAGKAGNGFELLQLDVTSDEMRRMRIAREARCFTASGPRAWPVIARSGGALFIRAYERGERVHLAMLARGYDGRLPALSDVPATARDWTLAAALPAAALVTCAMAWGMSP